MPSTRPGPLPLPLSWAHQILQVSIVILSHRGGVFSVLLQRCLRRCVFIKVPLVGRPLRIRRHLLAVLRCPRCQFVARLLQLCSTGGQAGGVSPCAIQLHKVQLLLDCLEVLTQQALVPHAVHSACGVLCAHEEGGAHDEGQHAQAGLNSTQATWHAHPSYCSLQRLQQRDLSATPRLTATTSLNGTCTHRSDQEEECKYWAASNYTCSQLRKLLVKGAVAGEGGAHHWEVDSGHVLLKSPDSLLVLRRECMWHKLCCAGVEARRIADGRRPPPCMRGRGPWAG